jgi:DNA primase
VASRSRAGAVFRRRRRRRTGEDPDTRVRTRGRATFEATLQAASPLAEALYGLLYEAAPPATPEQRAAFRVRLEGLAKTIPHQALAGEYRGALLDRFFAGRRKGSAGNGTAYRPVATHPAQPRPKPSEGGVSDERGRVLTAILLRHPGLLSDVEHAYTGLVLPSWLDRLRHALQDWAQAAEALDSTGLMTHLTEAGLAAEAAQALSAVPVPLPVCATSDVMPAEAEAGWWHIFGLMNRGRLQEEVAQAERDFVARADEAAQSRLIGLVRARNELMQSEQDVGA